ncbi:hypothetical protein VDIAB_271001 [Vibrio diabolicus]|nr:hypothetical protein VDIAB_271001 [Vibrio diabolicus]
MGLFAQKFALVQNVALFVGYLCLNLVHSVPSEAIWGKYVYSIPY